MKLRHASRQLGSAQARSRLLPERHRLLFHRHHWPRQNYSMALCSDCYFLNELLISNLEMLALAPLPASVEIYPQLMDSLAAKLHTVQPVVR
jgi:hypothetical protein